MADENLVTGLLTHKLVVTGILLLLSVLGYGIYQLYFSPLAKFPGPRIAALTTWYNAYHDLVRGGQYVWVVEDMHRKYGPIVRIRPDVLHVNDPNFIDTLYSQSPKQRRERYRTILQTLQADGSMLATKDHDLHRRRRAALNPYFSQQSVRKLEPIINDTLASLWRRMDGWARAGAPVEMNIAFRAATKDIIQRYALGDGSEKCLEMEDCNESFFAPMKPHPVVHLGTHVFWLAYVMANLPPAIMIALVPRVGVFARFMQVSNQSLENVGVVWLKLKIHHRGCLLKSTRSGARKNSQKEERSSTKSC